MKGQADDDYLIRIGLPREDAGRPHKYTVLRPL
jgi:hypothetical protein